jgi:polysaccharide pyruvyl transferase WcaK-like protein
MAKAPVISIIGGTIWGNRGAESMLVTVIGQLRGSFPDAHFNIFSYYPTKDRELIKDEKITILSGKPLSLATRHFIGALVGTVCKKIGTGLPKGEFFKIARALAASDILLDIGGITFSDGREKYLPFNILSIWPAILLGVPVVKLAQAVGPFKKPFNRMLAKIFLFRCAHIFARGEKTAEFLQEFNYPAEKFDTVADIAFLYQPEFSLSNENENRVASLIQRLEAAKKQGKRIIVFSPSILVESESRKKGLDYTGRFLDAVKTLGARGYLYVFMPNATREGSEKAHNNDLLTLSRMKTAWEVAQVEDNLSGDAEWVDFDINSASIRRIISQADVLVTSRYHAMISGLALEIPTVVIGWGHKYKETMAYFGLEEYSLDFGSSENDLAAIISKVMQDAKAVRNKIRMNLPQVRLLSKKQLDHLNRVLL